VIALLVAAAAVVAPGGNAGPEARGDTPLRVRVERQAFLMGTSARLVVLARSREQGLGALDRMLVALESAEAELSTWREDSLLSALNRQPVGTPWPATEALCDLLGELSLWRRATGGAFDPGVGSLLDAWGVRGPARHPAPGELAGALRDSGLRHLVIAEHPCRITRRRPVRLDAGAFGKGVGLDRAGRLVGDAPGPWLIDLGGQLAVGASFPRPWAVELADPRDRSRPALSLSIRSGSLATSGGSERDQHLDGATIGHVIDPRDGRPLSRPGTAVAWHPSALVADVLSTALYVMGPDAGLRWAEARGLAACFLDPAARGATRVRATTAFQQRFLAQRAGGREATKRPGTGDGRDP